MASSMERLAFDNAIESKKRLELKAFARTSLEIPTSC